jgi:hypothetical protein
VRVVGIGQNISERKQPFLETGATMPTNTLSKDIANGSQSAKRTILLADDDSQVREMLACVLKEYGFM